MIALSIALVCLAAFTGFLIYRNRILTNDNIRLGEQIKFLTGAESRLKDVFASLASSTLQTTTSHFLEMAKSNFQGHSDLQKADLDKRQAALDELLNPVRQSLTQYQEQISAMERERTRAFTAIDQELKRVSEVSGLLSKETSTLKDALKRPHVRGRWGEMQLRNCVELAGMSEHADVEFQSATRDSDDVTHIPDMVVRMPGGRQIIVDCKTPAEAFWASLEAPTEEARVAEMARHGRHVKEHVRALSTRDYPSVLKNTPDMTVMFLPNESFLYAALEKEPDLVEYALQRKILIATPPTLIGLLKVIRYGWNEERLAENAQKISEAGRELHKRLADFVDAYEKVGRFLDKAKEEYEKGRGRLHSRVLVQAQRFESLGVRSHKTLGSVDLEISEEARPSLESSLPDHSAEASNPDGPTV